MVYRTLWSLWDWGYGCGILPVYKVQPRVISVGNLTWGGTGKTPLVEYLARGLSRKGKRAAILSRGYGSRRDRDQADEVRWLRQKLNGIPIFAQPDRVASAQEAEKQGYEVLVLDDGFQHRRLARDLDVVTIDASAPFGNRYLFPRGNLREPLRGLKRADWIVLTRVDMANGDLEGLKREIRRYAPRANIAMAIHAPQYLRKKVEGGRSTSGNDEFLPLDWLKGKRIGALAAIGNPRAFQKTLENLGAKVEVSEFRRDHSSYDERDLESLVEKQRKFDLAGWMTTSKDAIKLEALTTQKPELKIWVLEVALKIIEGETELWQAIESLWV